MTLLREDFAQYRKIMGSGELYSSLYRYLVSESPCPRFLVKYVEVTLERAHPLADDKPHSESSVCGKYIPAVIYGRIEQECE